MQLNFWFEDKDKETIFMSYANDEKGWVSEGNTFTSVEKESDANVLVYFWNNAQLEQEFGSVPIWKELEGLSITDSRNPNIKKIYMNNDNWDKPPEQSIFSDLVLYRQYLVQHEVGHALGENHPSEILNDRFCHPMVQQSKKHDCKPNPWITIFTKNP
tara:strand:- start:212 stop:685 length:474 start_codon:yes stop_codon:yes gene_type:complete